jgi:hypothetical protein
MKVTLSGNLAVNIEGLQGHEILSLINMIKGASLEERRLFFSIVNILEKTPFDKLPFADIIKFAQQVKEMRRLQTMYFQTRAQKVLKASILQEGKVDDMVNDILNQL